MPYSVNGFSEINEDMVLQILLMLEVLFTQDSRVEDLFCDSSFFFLFSFLKIMLDLRLAKDNCNNILLVTCKCTKVYRKLFCVLNYLQPLVY